MHWMLLFVTALILSAPSLIPLKVRWMNFEGKILQLWVFIISNRFGSSWIALWLSIRFPYPSTLFLALTCNQYDPSDQLCQDIHPCIHIIIPCLFQEIKSLYPDVIEPLINAQLLENLSYFALYHLYLMFFNEKLFSLSLVVHLYPSA